MWKIKCRVEQLCARLFSLLGVGRIALWGLWRRSGRAVRVREHHHRIISHRKWKPWSCCRSEECAGGVVAVSRCVAVGKRKSDYALWRHWVFNYTHTTSTWGIIWLPFFQFIRGSPVVRAQFVSNSRVSLSACPSKRKQVDTIVKHRAVVFVRQLHFSMCRPTINSWHGVEWRCKDAARVNDARRPSESEWENANARKGGARKNGIKRFKLWSFHRRPHPAPPFFEIMILWIWMVFVRHRVVLVWCPTLGFHKI